MCGRATEQNRDPGYDRDASTQRINELRALLTEAQGLLPDRTVKSLMVLLGKLWMCSTQAGRGAAARATRYGRNDATRMPPEATNSIFSSRVSAPTR